MLGELKKQPQESKFRYEIKRNISFYNYFPTYLNVSIDNVTIKDVLKYFLQTIIDKYKEYSLINSYSLTCDIVKNYELKFNCDIIFTIIFNVYPELERIKKEEEIILKIEKEFKVFIQVLIYQFIFNSCFKIKNNCNCNKEVK